jgi:replicative DNA helicase
MDLILHRILETADIAAWSKINKRFFVSPYSRVYEIISAFYERYSKLPSFSELQAVTRTEYDSNLIKAVEKIKVPQELSTEILIEALVNEYAQKEALSELDKFLDDIVYNNAEDIVENLNRIALGLEEKIDSSETIVSMNQFLTIDDSLLLSRIPLGLNNMFDQHTFGLAPSEMIMFGGHRGTGKSLICNNLICNQIDQGNSALYFSIEMSGREIFQRNLSILSRVSNNNIKSGKLTDEEKWQIAQARASLTKDGSEDLLAKFRENNNLTEFERKLMERPLHPDKQIVIIDNSKLTLAHIDATISTYKTKFGDKLKVVVIDYLNQINEPDNLNWDVQVNISKKLKAFAKKYDIVMVTPYQTHKETGEARFSKGILDSTDWAFSLKAHKRAAGDKNDAIEFNCQKARGGSEVDFASIIDWNSLKIFGSENINIEKVPVKGAKAKAPPKSEDDL